jgi:alpha-galactosidase
MTGCLVSDPFYVDPNYETSGSSGGLVSRGGTSGAAGNVTSGGKAGSSGGAVSTDAGRAGAAQGGATGSRGGSSAQAGNSGGNTGANTASGGFPAQGGYTGGSTSAGSAGAWTLASFEIGTEGFGPPPEKQNSNTVATTTLFHTEGKQGLSVNMRSAEWVGAMFPQPLDLSGARRLKFDVRTTMSSLQVDVAIATGTSAWCQGAPMYSIPAQTSTTIEVALQDRTCTNYDLSHVRGVYIWFAVGNYYIDYLRTE